MSYAEHGSRIFLTGQCNTNPLLRYGDYVVRRKRSEGRLKLFNSCSDLRAWSPDALDNCRHFREIIESRVPSGRIVPYEVLIENLITMGQTELASVRRQLEKYKSLRLTPEQKKQLREIDYSNDLEIERSAVELHRKTGSVEDETGTAKRSGTPKQSRCCSSKNFHDVETDRDFSSAEDSEGSQVGTVSSSGTYEESDRINEKIHSRRANQEVIIKKDSEIIALNHELAAKNAELDEVREICRNLETSLNEKVRTLETLRTNLKTSQEQLLTAGDRMHTQVEEWKQKFFDAKCLTDHLKSTLAEKSRVCTIHNQEMQDLRGRAQDAETLRQERDSLRRKFGEMNVLMDERNDLIKLNREQAISLADQEDEINRLLGFIKQTLSEYNKQEMKMKCELHELRSELDAKNSTISQFETHQVTVRKEISSIGSLSKVQTSEIRKIRRSLHEDLEAVEDELSRRCGAPENHFHQRVNMASKSQQIGNFTNDERMIHTSWQRNEDYMECCIEQLTMQVSSTRVPIEQEQAAIIDQKIFSDFTNSKEKIQRLIIKLEPYLKERVVLIGKVKSLREALQDLKQDSESREREIQKQRSSETKKHHRELESYARKITHLENLLEKKGGRYERNEKIDSEIDEFLAMHVNRSINKLFKLSTGLRGAGDEMAKIRNEAVTREAEIAKLRNQVQFHVTSRGQGDEVTNQSTREIVRLKTEKKRLLEELKKQEEALRATREDLQSREFELKGLKRQKNDMSAQHKREVLKKKKLFDGLVGKNEALVRENEGLRKTVLMINDLVVESDAMKIKLESLQEDNSNLIEANASMIKRCEDYENRILDFSKRETHTKEALELAQAKAQEEILNNKVLVEKLQNENETLANESREYESKIERLTEQLRKTEENGKIFDAMENVWTEMSKIDKDKQVLDERATRLRCSFEDHRRINDKLENRLKLQITENEIVENKIKQLRHDIDGITNQEMPEAIVKKLLRDLPDKIYGCLEKMRGKMTVKNTEVPLWQSEMDELRKKLVEDNTLIGVLHEEIKSWKNKLSQAETKMAALEMANLDLQEKLNSQTNNSSTEKQLPADMEMEMRSREMVMEKLMRDIGVKNEELRNLSEKIDSLVKEKNDISNELKSEKELRQEQLKDMQQKHNARMKAFHDKHNDSMKKLLAQQEEIMKNTDNPFDSETCLKSLTMKEMAELHKRICALSPCELIVGEASKTRALNDKQNQQLQQDEKLNTDMFHMKNGHHKDLDVTGFPYTYERRKFEILKEKAVVTSFDKKTFDTQRKMFFHQCAIVPKYISH